MLSAIALASALTGLALAAPVPHAEESVQTYGPFNATHFYSTEYTGSCGYTNRTNQFIASIALNDSSKLGDACGRTINVTSLWNDEHVLAQVVDECEHCGSGYLNLSRVAFEEVAPITYEYFGATYTFTEEDAPVTSSSSSSPASGHSHNRPQQEVSHEHESEEEHSSSSSSHVRTPEHTQSSSSSSVRAEYTSSSSSSRQAEHTSSSSSSSSRQAEHTPSSSASSSSSSSWSRQPEHTWSSSSSSSRQAEYTPSTSSSSSSPRWTSSSSSSRYTPTTTSTRREEPAYTPQAQPAPQPEPQRQSGGNSGRATYFYQGGNAGHCGNVNSDSAYIVALSSSVFNMGRCGAGVRITNTANGRSAYATVADSCPGCGAGDLDLSVGLFSSLGSTSQGVLPISWSFA